jgi:hypothetical protein
MKTFKRFYKSIFIVILLVLISCTREDQEYSLNNPKGLSTNSLIYFKKIDHTIVEADGTSYSTIAVQIHPETDPQYRSISLKTTIGKFANGRTTDTISANADGLVYFTVKSNVPERAKISAMVRSYSIDTLIDFRPALPDDLLIGADQFVINTTQSVTINTNLMRNSFRWIVSDPIKIFYVVKPLATQSYPLIYPSFAMSTQGTSTITITNPFGITGDFKVETKALSASNDTLRKTLTFRIN